MIARILFLILIFPFYSFSQYHSQEIDSLLIAENIVLKFRLSKEKLIYWNNEIIKTSQKMGYPKGEVLGLINIANVLWGNTQYKESLKFLDIAADRAKVISDEYTLGRLFIEYAQVYHQLGLSERAVRYSNIAIGYYLKLKDVDPYKRALQYAYGCRADYYRGINPKEALRSLHKAINYYPTPLDISNIAKYYMDIDKNTDSAKYYLDQSFALLKKPEFVGNNYQRIMALRTQGEFELSQKEYEAAVESFRDALSLHPHISNLRVELSLYKLLAKSYKQLGQYKKQITFERKSALLNDSLSRIKSAGIVISVDKLLKENTSVKNVSAKRQWSLGVMTAFMEFLTVGGLLLIFFYKAQIKINKRIMNEKEELNLELLRQIRINYETLILLAKENSPKFLLAFQDMYPNFCNKLREFEPNISNENLKFCAFLKLNFSTREMADYLYVEVRTIQTRKYRLRKQLNLGSDVDLNVFMDKLV